MITSSLATVLGLHTIAWVSFDYATCISMNFRSHMEGETI